MNIVAAVPQSQPHLGNVGHSVCEAATPNQPLKSSDHSAEIGLVVVAVLLFLLGFSKGGN